MKRRAVSAMAAAGLLRGVAIAAANQLVKVSARLHQVVVHRTSHGEIEHAFRVLALALRTLAFGIKKPVRPSTVVANPSKAYAKVFEGHGFTSLSAGPP